MGSRGCRDELRSGGFFGEVAEGIVCVAKVVEEGVVIEKREPTLR